jgi:hypothetical protein
MSEFVENLRTQRSLEIKNVVELKEFQYKVENEFIFAVVDIILQDSQKHMKL